MQLLTNTKIEKCAANSGDGRIVIQSTYYDGECIVATNGKIIAVNPVTGDDHDTIGSIPKEVLAEARKQKNLGVVHCNKGFTFPASNIEFKRDLSKVNYPNWHGVVEQSETADHDFCIDVDLLKLLADAICTKSKGVRLRIKISDKLSSIRVEPITKNGNFGVIMPMRG